MIGTLTLPEKKAFMGTIIVLEHDRYTRKSDNEERDIWNVMVQTEQGEVLDLVTFNELDEKFAVDAKVAGSYEMRRLGTGYPSEEEEEGLIAFSGNNDVITKMFAITVK